MIGNRWMAVSNWQNRPMISCSKSPYDLTNQLDREALTHTHTNTHTLTHTNTPEWLYYRGSGLRFFGCDFGTSTRCFRCQPSDWPRSRRRLDKSAARATQRAASDSRSSERTATLAWRFWSPIRTRLERARLPSDMGTCVCACQWRELKLIIKWNKMPFVYLFV